MSEWQPIETAPDGVKALITDGKEVTAAKIDRQLFKPDIRFEGIMFSGHEWDWDFDIADITHWMPLPEPFK